MLAFTNEPVRINVTIHFKIELSKNVFITSVYCAPDQNILYTENYMHRVKYFEHGRSPTTKTREMDTYFPNFCLAPSSI